MHSSASSKQLPWSTTQNEFIRKWHEIDFPIGTLMLLRSILDDRIRPSFWPTYWKSDTSSWCSKSQIFSKCFYRYIPSRGKNDDAQTKSSYYIESAFTTSLSCFFMWPQYLVKRALRRQTNLKNKAKKYSNTDGGRGRFYVVHYQNSERIQKHFRISRFCEIFFVVTLHKSSARS